MTAFNKGEIPFIVLLLPFLAGLCLSVFFPFAGYNTWLLTLTGGLTLLFIGLNIAYQKLSIYKHRWLGGLIMHAILLIAGIYCFDAHREINRDNHFSKFKSRYLIATINNQPKLNGQTLRFTANVEQAYINEQLKSVSGHILISVKTDSTIKTTLQYGDRLLVPAAFTPIEPPLNPAEFNYKSYMAHQNIYQQLYLNIKQINVLDSGKGNMLVAYALNLRLKLVNNLKANMRDSDAIAVASTIILGYRADLRKDVRETYAKTGTMHLLSVAGMHVGLVYLLVSFVLSFLVRIKHGKLIRIVLTILLIWCYALITGFSPAVCRATLMLTAVIIGSSFSRHINKLNVLAVSAFILLLYNPFLITDVGFQLSYIAVGGIIITQPYIYKWLNIKNPLLNRLWLVASVSISAQMVLFPLGVFYFHDFPVYFLGSNLFVVIPSAVTMYVGIIYLALPAIPGLSAALAWILEHTIIIMTKTLAFIEHAPFGSINKIWFSITDVVLIYVLLISLLIFVLYQNKVWLKVSMGTALIIVISLSLKQFEILNSSNISFYSINKHTVILFQNGSNGVLLSDIKPTDGNFQYAIQPSLDSCGITDVNYLDLSSDMNNAYIAKTGNLLQVSNKRILILDKHFGKKVFQHKLNVDYIYITGSPGINLQYLTENYTFKMLIAGNNNSPYFVKQLENEAMLATLPFYNLKRNKAFITASNIDYHTNP